MTIITNPPARRSVIVAIFTAALLLGGIGVAAASPASADDCAIPWGSLAKTSDGSAAGTVDDVRTGRHSCFDRLVVDLDGDRPGFLVDYVDTLAADGSGEIVPVSGGAVLRVIVRAPAYDDTGSATIDPSTVSGANVAGYRTFRDIEWAGSFEGQTTLGLGVRARLPFRVFTLDGPGAGSRLVVDVAHRWDQPPTGDDLVPVRPGGTLAVMGVAHDDVLNIRAGAGTNHRIVTTAGPTDQVVATGKAKMLTRSIWYEVTVNGTTGWAASRHLAIPGSVDDITAAYLAQHPRPSADSMVELGAAVAADFLPAEQGSFTAMSVAPTMGDLGEVTVDVVGLADDSVAGLRLHIFAEPNDTGDSFELRTIEATQFCARGGFGGPSCT